MPNHTPKQHPPDQHTPYHLERKGRAGNGRGGEGAPLEEVIATHLAPHSGGCPSATQTPHIIHKTRTAFVDDVKLLCGVGAPSTAEEAHTRSGLRMPNRTPARAYT